jgi:hypothetical protein
MASTSASEISEGSSLSDFIVTLAFKISSWGISTFLGVAAKSFSGSWYVISFFRFFNSSSARFPSSFPI